MNDPQRKPVGRPFKKNDPRINRRGRPKHFDDFRRLAQQIASEKVVDAAGNTLTQIESILRSWARSKEPQLQRAFVEYCYGKVPEKIETTGLEPKTVLRLHFAHEEPGYVPASAVGSRALPGTEPPKDYQSPARAFPGPAQMKLIRDGDEKDLPPPSA